MNKDQPVGDCPGFATDTSCRESLFGSRVWRLLSCVFLDNQLNLEPAGWGTQFPTLMDSLYQGTLSAHKADAALLELAEAKKGLAGFPPSRVVWDIENLNASPPWGDSISKEITSLANYFVTSDGRDLFEVLKQALSVLKQAGGQLSVG